MNDLLELKGRLEAAPYSGPVVTNLPRTKKIESKK